MNIDELLHRERTSLANAAAAVCTASRMAHEGLARGYGARLRLADAGRDAGDGATSHAAAL